MKPVAFDPFHMFGKETSKNLCGHSIVWLNGFGAGSYVYVDQIMFRDINI